MKFSNTYIIFVLIFLLIIFQRHETNAQEKKSCLNYYHFLMNIDLSKKKIPLIVRNKMPREFCDPPFKENDHHNVEIIFSDLKTKKTLFTQKRYLELLTQGDYFRKNDKGVETIRPSFKKDAGITFAMYVPLAPLKEKSNKLSPSFSAFPSFKVEIYRTNDKSLLAKGNYESDNSNIKK